MKKAYIPEKLCNSLPKQMIEYMKYIQNLLFDENPNYKYLKNLFKSILKDMNVLLFSWIKQYTIFKKICEYFIKRVKSPFLILKALRQNSIDRQSRENSSNSLGNYSCESFRDNFKNQNIKIIRNVSKDNFKSENIIPFKSKNNTNTMIVFS